MNSRLIGDYIYHPDGPRTAVRDQVMTSKTHEDGTAISAGFTVSTR